MLSLLRKPNALCILLLRLLNVAAALCRTCTREGERARRRQHLRNSEWPLKPRPAKQAAREAASFAAGRTRSPCPATSSGSSSGASSCAQSGTICSLTQISLPQISHLRKKEQVSRIRLAQRQCQQIVLADWTARRRGLDDKPVLGPPRLGSRWGTAWRRSCHSRNAPPAQKTHCRHK